MSQRTLFRFVFAIAVVGILNWPVVAQQPRAAAKPKRDGRVFDPVIQAAQVRPHVEFLASPNLRGRRGRDAVEAANYVRDRFEQLKLRPLFKDGSFFQPIPGPKLEDGTPTRYGQNIGAWLPGSDPLLRDEFVIVSAHYDHLGSRGGVIFHGADDNASGTSLLLEVAREFAARKERPKRSLVFIGFDLEENLLMGSRWFVSHPPWPLQKVKLFTTADMVGRALGDLPIKTIFVMGSEHGTTLPRVLNQIGQPKGFGIARLGIDLIGTRSDYGPFRDRRIPFLFFSTGQHPDYHKPTDVPEKINYDQVAAVASLVLEITGQVADSPDPPEWEAEVHARMEEVESLHRIARLLLESDNGSRPLSAFQKFIVSQAEVRTRLIIERGKVTDEERAGLIRTAQVLLLSVL